MAVVPGLVDSHIHPFWGTLQTRGVDLRSAATLDEVRARLAAERRRCGPTAWVLGHSARYEPFHGVRACGRTRSPRPSATRPALLNFFDGHTALATPAGARAGGRSPARASSSESAEIVVDPDGRPTGALLESAARWTSSRDVVPEVDRGRAARRVRRDAAARSTASGLTGAHVMIGDPELLDDVPRARGARRPDRCGWSCRCTRSRRSATRRSSGGSALAARARAAVAGRDGEVLPRRRARVRHRVARRPRAAAA